MTELFNMIEPATFVLICDEPFCNFVYVHDAP